MTSSLVADALADFLEYEVSHFIKVVRVEEYVGNATSAMRASTQRKPPALPTKARRGAARLWRRLLPHTPVPLFMRDAPPPISDPAPAVAAPEAAPLTSPVPASTPAPEDARAGYGYARSGVGHGYGRTDSGYSHGGSLPAQDTLGPVNWHVRVVADLVVFVQITGLAAVPKPCAYASCLCLVPTPCA